MTPVGVLEVLGKQEGEGVVDVGTDRVDGVVGANFETGVGGIVIGIGIGIGSIGTAVVFWGGVGRFHRVLHLGRNG